MDLQRARITLANINFSQIAHNLLAPIMGLRESFRRPEKIGKELKKLMGGA